MTDHADVIREAMRAGLTVFSERDGDIYTAGCAALDALVAERDALKEANHGRLVAAWDDIASLRDQLQGRFEQIAELTAERDEARRLLREVVKADRQDTQMGYPIPGDSCMGAFIGLVLMQYLDGLAAPTKEGT